MQTEVSNGPPVHSESTFSETFSAPGGPNGIAVDVLSKSHLKGQERLTSKFSITQWISCFQERLRSVCSWLSSPESRRTSKSEVS